MDETQESLFVSTFRVEELEHRKVVKEGVGKRHVYVGLCDGVMTKWITSGVWDGKLRLVNGEYKDARGHEILVLEDDEDEWEDW